MYIINKITANPTVDFAAEELKKYLRMMMPNAGEIEITYAPDANTGYRFGLMEDFSISCDEAKDKKLDDVIYIDTDDQGGIIAGSNPRSVLLAVYRFLRFNGCRWLFPGIDGEFIPVQPVKGVKYRKMADHRYRGQCNEGAEYQTCMIDAIDFTPKIGMNVFMQEFDIPRYYYDHYYNHTENPTIEPEPITSETVLQWKKQCECEIKKRGLQYHDMGHGWMVSAFGIDTASGWDRSNPPALTDEQKQFLAKINGERGIYQCVLNTNACMSNPEARRRIANHVADYATVNSHVDFLHIWLADGWNNHCECDECQKKTASDWYVILLNDIDEEMTRRKLNNKLVFIVYVDTFWAPIFERIKNPSRYSMLFAPIFRTYSETYGETPDATKLTPYVRNKLTNPASMSACLAYLEEWKKVYSGDCCCYEYHFWRHQVYDYGHRYLGKLLYDDVKGLKKCGIRGMIQDGSQRSFFPNGFAFYVYGETLFDSSITFEALTEDYFSHAYGEKWKDVVAYLDTLSELCHFEYMSGRASKDMSIHRYYNPDVTKDIEKIVDVIADFLPTIKANRVQKYRAQSVAWQLLADHADMCTYFAKVRALQSSGNFKDALAITNAFREDFGRRERYLAPYFDYFNYARNGC